MKINGPVSVPPIIPITRSKRGTSSPIITANATSTERTRHRFRLNPTLNYIFLLHLNKFFLPDILRDIFRVSSMCWNSAELPTALDRHNCSVTIIMAKYSKLLRGSSSRMLGVTELPYRYAATIVVTAAIKHVTEKTIQINNKILVQANKFTKYSIRYSMANFVFFLHIHFNCHKHRMNIKLKCNHSVSFKKCTNFWEAYSINNCTSLCFVCTNL